MADVLASHARTGGLCGQPCRGVPTYQRTGQVDLPRGTSREDRLGRIGEQVEGAEGGLKHTGQVDLPIGASREDRREQIADPQLVHSPCFLSDF